MDILKRKVFQYCVQPVDQYFILPLVEKSFLTFIKIGRKFGLDNENPDWPDGPLHHAIQIEFPPVALFFIEEGEDTNRLDSDQRSPLDWALEKDLFEVFKKLVENQADVNFVAHDNLSLLFSAICQYKEEYAEILIQNGANVNWVCLNSNRTSLHAAAVFGATGIAKTLIN